MRKHNADSPEKNPSPAIQSIYEIAPAPSGKKYHSSNTLLHFPGSLNAPLSLPQRAAAVFPPASGAFLCNDMDLQVVEETIEKTLAFKLKF